MRFSIFVAKKYFLSLKNNNAVNILSGISILGVSISTMAMFIVLSVFSGLQESTEKMFSIFDSDIKITPKKGKFFEIEEKKIDEIKSIDFVGYVSKILEDKVLVDYRGSNYIAYIKGVEESFIKNQEIANSVIYGDWFSYDKKVPYTVLGISVAYKLGIPVNSDLQPISIFYINKDAQLNGTDELFFEKKFLNKGMLSIDKEVNSKYILTKLDDVKNLFRDDRISSLEIEFKEDLEDNQVLEIKNKILNIVDDNFEVKTSEEQHEIFYKMMNTEKLVSFGVLVLVMIIALFNIVGSVVMLVLDKKENIKTLINLGLDVPRVQGIFIYQGVLITITGCSIGMFLSSLFVLLQIKYGFITMNVTNMVYPLKFEMFNFFVTIFTMLTLGIFSSYFSVKYILKKKIIQTF